MTEPSMGSHEIAAAMNNYFAWVETLPARRDTLTADECRQMAASIGGGSIIVPYEVDEIIQVALIYTNYVAQTLLRISDLLDEASDSGLLNTLIDDLTK